MNSSKFQITKTQIKAEQYRRSFYRFVKAAWNEIDPSEYVDSKYIEVICSHLEWVIETGESLVINIPPRHAKSMIVSVMLNGWLWADPKKRHLSILAATHSEKLTLRDSRLARELIKSPWFIKHFGDVGFLPDQDVKSRFINSSKGSRQSVSLSGSVTGDGAHIRIIDDAVDASKSTNDIALEGVCSWYDETFSSRIIDPNYRPVILVMQRLSQNDLSAHLIDRDVKLLCLPIEYDPNHPTPSTTPPEAWPDGLDGEWRTEKGQLLCPERYDQDYVSEQKAAMGPFASSGQLNQYPVSPEGGILQRSQFGKYRNLDLINFKRLIVTVDTAEKTGKGHAFSVFGLFGVRYQDNNLYVLDVLRGKWEINDLELHTLAFWNKHNNKMPNANPSFSSFGIEDKSSGTQLLQKLRHQIGVIPIQRVKKAKNGQPVQAIKKDERLNQLSNWLVLNNGKILTPAEPTVYTGAEWVADYESELLSKQHQGEALGFWDQADVTSDAGFDLLVSGDFQLNAQHLGL